MSDLQFLLNEINRIDGCERTKRKCVDVISRCVGLTIYFARRELDTTRLERDAVARSMIEKGAKKAEIAQALMTRFGVCRTTAYETIAKVEGLIL
jgi:hypothetical protein